MNDLTLRLLRLFVLLASLSVHEYAHARSAYKLGDSTAAEAGRMTLNPLAHVEPIGFMMMLFAPVAWAKPVPVNSSRFRRDVTQRRGNAIVSFAGPLSNIILATIIYMLFVGFTYLPMPTSSGGVNVMRVFGTLLQLAYMLNLNLAIFNLLPIPPLDGFNLIGQWLPQNIYYFLIRNSRYFFMGILASVILAPQLLTTVLSVLRTPLSYVVQLPGMLLNTILQQVL